MLVDDGPAKANIKVNVFLFDQNTASESTPVSESEAHPANIVGAQDNCFKVDW